MDKWPFLFCLYIFFDETIAICPDDWIRKGNHCYYISEDRKSQEEAKAHCESFGGGLVTITSPDEHEYISHYLQKITPEGFARHYYWIDGRRQNGPDRHLIMSEVDSELLSYLGKGHFQAGSLLGAEDCLSLSSLYNFDFSDLGCREQHQFVCRKTDSFDTVICADSHTGRTEPTSKSPASTKSLKTTEHTSQATTPSTLSPTTTTVSLLWHLINKTASASK